MRLVLEKVILPLARYSLEIDAVIERRVTAIFGPSGAGKTSLLEIIAGLRRPSGGKVTLDGATLVDAGARVFARAEHRGIGYVPQDGALFPHLNVRQNLRYGFDPTQARQAGLTFEHVSEVLEVDALAPRSIDTLSGGEKQRVALGRALLAGPRLLLLDEPLANLDLALKERLLPYLLRVRDEFSIPMIYVSHSADEIVALCDEALVLTQGKLVKRGAPSEIFVADSTPRFRARED